MLALAGIALGAAAVFAGGWWLGARAERRRRDGVQMIGRDRGAWSDL